MKDYKIDFTTMTLTMSKAFAEEAYSPSSEAYKTIKRLQKDFPNLTVAKRTHRSPNKANPNKGITYKNMERYIRLFSNADELLEAFERVKAQASVQKGSYLIVRNWFDEQFPNYGKITSWTECEVILLPLEKVKKEEVA